MIFPLLLALTMPIYPSYDIYCASMEDVVAFRISAEEKVTRVWGSSPLEPVSFNYEIKRDPEGGRLANVITKDRNGFQIKYQIKGLFFIPYLRTKFANYDGRVHEDEGACMMQIIKDPA